VWRIEPDRHLPIASPAPRGCKARTTTNSLPGTYRRHWETFHGNEAEADARLARLAESVRLPHRFGDMRVRELIDRYLTWLEDGHHHPKVTNWRRLNDQILDPALGARRAVLVDTADVFEFLRDQHQAGTPRDVIKDLRALLVQSWNWAQQHRWTNQNPPTDVPLRDVIS
jgi:hypothetical protein